MSKSKKEFFKYGAVNLSVVDMQESIEFWTEVIGLKKDEDISDQYLKLTNGKINLVNLYPEAQKSFQNGFSSLYHLAIHIPTEKEFAQILYKFISSGISISPTDHVFSKAIYLEDPNGITIEITLETPERFDRYDLESGSFRLIDDQGIPRPVTGPLDVNEMLSDYELSKDYSGLSDETYIGHVHLYVNDLLQNYDFYKILGFEKSIFSQQFSFADLSAGGEFNHRIAMNTWYSKGQPQLSKEYANMKSFEMIYNSKEDLEEVLKKIKAYEEGENGYWVQDPSGNKILISYY